MNNTSRHVKLAKQKSSYFTFFCGIKEKNSIGQKHHHGEKVRSIQLQFIKSLYE